MSLFDEKTVIVAGGAGGIGRVIALGFAREGANVVVNDIGSLRDGTGSSEEPARRVVEEIAAEGGHAVASSDPIHTDAGATAVVDLAKSTYGGVHAVVNAAGIARDDALTKVEVADVRALFDTHVLGSLLLTKAAAREMIPAGGGRIVLFTSVAGLRGNTRQASTSAADAGVLGLMRTSAIELQRHKIYVNAIAPVAKTRLTEDLPLFENVTSMTPEHVAPVALYLASDLAGDKTGHVLAVAGAQLYAFKLLQTTGRFKEGGGAWTPDEIATHFDTIMSAAPGSSGRRGL